MCDKKLFELMLEKNMRRELAGNFDSMEMREFLQKGIELFEAVEAQQQQIRLLQVAMAKPEETNRTKLTICGMDLFICYTDSERQNVMELAQLEQCNKELQEKNERLRDMLHSCDPFVVNPESECQECGQGVGEIACIFCGNSIEAGHAEDCKYAKEVGKKC